MVVSANSAQPAISLIAIEKLKCSSKSEAPQRPIKLPLERYTYLVPLEYSSTYTINLIYE